MRRPTLGAAWAPVDEYVDAVEISGISVQLVGLATTHRSGRTVTGSAGALEGNVYQRACWELIERAAVVEAAESVEVADLVDRSGAAVDCRVLGSLFPRAPEGRNCRYSLSNGAALGADFDDACRRAHEELVERDRVLRSWHGHAIPVGLPTPDLLPSAWAEHYRFELARVDPSDALDATCALFGFPKRTDVPFAAGFGAGPTTEAATEAAVREVIQVIGFLWGEEIPKQPPPLGASPDYHQETFLFPGNQPRIARWLAGDHVLTPDALREECSTAELYVDITPRWLVNGCRVVKAIRGGTLALTFGTDHPHVGSEVPLERRVHPIA